MKSKRFDQRVLSDHLSIQNVYVQVYEKNSILQKILIE